MLILAILLFGTLVGGVARLLLPGRQHLSLPATTIAGLIGAGTAGSAAAAVFDRGLTWSGPSIVGSILGAVGVVAIAEWVNRRRAVRAAQVPTPDLVAMGESERIEFKSSARYNIHTGDKDARIELAIARTVVGFANANGGTLLIGIDDDGDAIGLEHDLRLVKGGDIDRYQLWLHDLLDRCIGRELHRLTAISFCRIDAHDVARIDVQPANEPVFLHPHTGERQTQFHVRIGNSTRQLPIDEAITYVGRRFHGRRPLSVRGATDESARGFRAGYFGVRGSGRITSAE